MKDFEIVFREGRFVNGRLLQAKVWAIEPEKYPRRAYMRGDLLIGFVVGTKVSKRAVDRNRMKRQMREVVRLLLKDKKIKSGFVIAIIAKRDMLGKEYTEIEQSLLSVLGQAGVLC